MGNFFSQREGEGKTRVGLIWFIRFEREGERETESMRGVWVGPQRLTGYCRSRVFCCCTGWTIIECMVSDSGRRFNANWFIL